MLCKAVDGFLFSSILSPESQQTCDSGVCVGFKVTKRRAILQPNAERTQRINSKNATSHTGPSDARPR